MTIQMTLLTRAECTAKNIARNLCFDVFC